MLSRTADDLFWTSRYVERAVSMVRLIDVTWHLELDVGDEDESQLWTPVLHYGDLAFPGATTGAPAPTSSDVRRYLGLDRHNPNSVVACMSAARTAARGVRDSISSEMWETLNTLYLSLVDPRLSAEAEADPHTFYRGVREGAQFVQGLADSTLAHDEPWDFFCLGKYLERADCIARVLRLHTHLLEGLHNADAEPMLWLALLRSCGSAEAYARYYSLRVEPARAIEFLLLNPVFPQSIRFSVDAAFDSLKAIAAVQEREGPSPTPPLRILGRLRARLDFTAVDEVLEQGIRTVLGRIQREIALVCDDVTRAYLRDEPQRQPVVAAERAAMIMAAQQQQQ
jgi:uncharacterized alpha-E superfamily protein